MLPARRALDTAASLIAAQFEELRTLDVRPFGHGEDHDLYLVGASIVFRFPRRDDDAWLNREVRILELLSDRSLRVPVVEWHGIASAEFPHPFVGYRMLPGVTIVGTPAPGLAGDLGAFLQTLHAVEPNGIPGTPDGWEYEPWSTLADEVAASAPEVTGLLDDALRHAAAPYLAGEVTPPPRGSILRLIHNDLSAEHVLVDAGSGRLSGVVDLADAMMGDPVLDLVGLLTIGDWSFVADVLAHYALDLGAGSCDRLEWLSRMLTLHWLGDAVREGEERLATRHLLWVRRAFATLPFDASALNHGRAPTATPSPEL